MKSLILAFFAWLLLFVSPISYASLSQFYTKTGKITVSVDGAGSISASHIAEVEKLSDTAIVSAAYVMSSAIGDKGISDGDISINGNAISWDETITLGTFTNVRADVTNIVKPIVDASGAGRIPFTFTEINTVTNDGETLVVVFDDPAQTADKTISLFFGMQSSAGDSFAMELVKPGGPQANVAVADFGIAIGFGFQGDQSSFIGINGTRLTSSAGGQDDGHANNGALITVGGLEDRNDNPADPNAQPNGDTRIDDELYTLLPFIDSNTSSLLVETENLNNDDDIYFSYLILSSAEEGDDISLIPETSDGTIGDNVTVTATLLTSSGTPISGGAVNFDINSGPNSGSIFTTTSDTNGKASISYSSTLEGTDQILASSSTVTSDSNIISVIWSEPEVSGEISLLPETANATIGNNVTVTATLLTSSGTPISGEAVNFNVSSGPNSGTVYSATSDANGKASVSYSSTDAGTDQMYASSSEHITDSNTISVLWTEKSVEPPVSHPTAKPIPTLSEWSLMWMSFLLVMVALRHQRNFKH